jgi:hypothetical protein
MTYLKTYLKLLIWHATLRSFDIDRIFNVIACRLVTNCKIANLLTILLSIAIVISNQKVRFKFMFSDRYESFYTNAASWGFPRGTVRSKFLRTLTRQKAALLLDAQHAAHVSAHPRQGNRRHDVSPDTGGTIPRGRILFYIIWVRKHAVDCPIENIILTLNGRCDSNCFICPNGVRDHLQIYIFVLPTYPC